MKPHLIVPMGGAGSRFYKDGYMIPKPMIEIAGKPFFYWATRSISKFVELEDITYVVLKEHVECFKIDELIYKYFPDANIVLIDEVTPGPVFTCLEGIKQIQDDAPLIFNDCDHMFYCKELNELLVGNSAEVDGALVTFCSDIPHFSYVRYDEKNEIVGTVEKQVVSNRAICGAYYFKSADLFKILAKDYIEYCPYKETFLSGMYNVMCEKGYLVKDFLLDFHVEFGTPEEYEIAQRSMYFEQLN